MAASGFKACEYPDMTRFRHVALVMVLAALALPTPAQGLPANTRVQVYTTGLEFPVDAPEPPGSS
jgi:hypothetical protein